MRSCLLPPAVLVAIALATASPATAQMPSQKEMEEAMRQMQRAMESLTPEQRKMLQETQRQMQQQPAPGAEDDEIGVPARDAARLARVPRQPLTGAQLKAHVQSLQPRLRQALSPDALRRADLVEDVQRKAGGDLTLRLRAAANALAAWGAWPEATYLTGKVALASGQAQDLGNLAAFLTMQKAPQAALPILITLDARYPGNSTILNNLGQAWFELGEVKEAERVLVLAVRRAPNHPQANVTKSRIEEARGDRSAAAASMRAAIRGGYSEAKVQRLRSLGGKLAAGDARWMLNKPAHPLGLSDLAPPAYPENAGQTVDAAVLWKAYQQRLLESSAQLRARIGRATAQRAGAALPGPVPGTRLRATGQAGEMLRFHAPLAPLANEVMRADEQAARAEAQRVTTAWTQAQQFETAERARLEQQVRALHAEGEQRYRNVSGGYQLEYSCKQVVAAQTAYLQKVTPVLETAARDLVGFYHRRIGDMANLAQYSMSDAEFELAKDNFRLQFLQQVERAHIVVMAKEGKAGFFGAGMAYPYERICLLRPPARPPKHKLVDFDELNCQHVVSFAAPGIGRFDIRCNTASVELDPFAIPLKVKWTEDLIKDRVLTASVEVQKKVSDELKVSVGVRGEFDDQGLKSGAVGVGAEAGVLEKEGGPLEVGMGARGGIGVEFDRSGITDVRIDAGLESKASSTVGKTDAASPGVEGKTSVSGTWSWNAGTSAGISGSFDRTFF